MPVESEDYKLEVLEYAVNQCIDRLLPESNKDALSIILYKSNEVVWKVATEIYTKSGYQIDFVFIRDILNLKVEPLHRKIAEKEKIRKEQERITKAKEADEAKIREELKAKRIAREVEEAKIKAKLEAEKLAKIAEQEQIKKERKEKEKKKLQEFNETNPGIHINEYEELETFLEVFERVKNVIVEQLEVNREEINKEEIELDTVLTTDLGVEDRYSSFSGHFERLELAMGIEHEFDVEISYEESETILFLSVGQLVNLVLQKI
jgi:acyl carrier protein